MDPYLEARWSDVHSKLISFMGEEIQRRLPSSLRARAEERLLLETAEEEAGQWYQADLAVVDTGRPASSMAGGSAVATIEPVTVRQHDAPVIHRLLQIIDRTSGNRVITVVEILSPWNKGAGRLNNDYRRKLDDYARGGVSVVEIDLLRQPARGRMAVTEADIPLRRRAPYLVCVRYAWEPDAWEAYPIPLRQPLPRIPIPLRRDEAALGLDLQPLIDRVYAAGGHDDIDYSKPAAPPLEAADAQWADELLKAAGKR